MSLYSDFYPQTGTDLVPGVVQNISNVAVMDGVNYLDITDGVIVDKTLYPDLDANLYVPQIDNSSLQQEINKATTNFGETVEIYKDTVAVGSGTTSEVNIYVRSGVTWSLEQTIPNPTGVGDSGFGWALSIYEDTLVIGAPYDNTHTNDTGSVWIYTRSAGVWSLQQQIDNPHATTAFNSYFGVSISLYQDTVAIGAMKQDPNTAGAVYVYTRSGAAWSEEQILYGNEASTSFFGESVSLQGNTLAISSSADDTLFFNSGAAYVFTRTGTTWTQEAKITNPGSATYFARNLSYDNNTLVIRSNETVGGFTNAGILWVYTRTAGVWSLQQSIPHPYPVANSEYFGWEVRVKGDILVVGNKWLATDGYPLGGVIAFKRTGTTWVLEKHFHPENVLNSYYGESVSIYGDTIAVGQYDSNTIYVYTIPDSNTFLIQGQDQAIKLTK